MTFLDLKADLPWEANWLKPDEVQPQTDSWVGEKINYLAHEGTIWANTNWKMKFIDQKRHLDGYKGKIFEVSLDNGKSHCISLNGYYLSRLLRDEKYPRRWQNISPHIKQSKPDEEQ